MIIELSKEQYRKLAELVFLGNWLANSTKVGDEINQEYEEVEQLIYSYAKEMGMEDLIVYDQQSGEYFPTRTFEESMEPYIDAYDEFTFWQDLASRLANRDLIRETGPVHKLTDRQRDRLFELEEMYENEFVEHGLMNLELVKKNKKK